MEIKNGFEEGYRLKAAQIYDEAFSYKLQRIIKDGKKRREILSESFIPEYSISAFHNNELIGIAGFNNAIGSFTGGINFSILSNKLGILQAVKAGTLLSILDSKPVPGELFIEGLAVNSDYRGMGIGSRLIDSVCILAKSYGFTSVGLEVVDTNQLAKKLYEEKGFQVIDNKKVPLGKTLFGFTASERMIKSLN